MDYRLLSNNNNTYPTHHHWFPKMCSCLETTTTLSRTCGSNRSSRNYNRLTTRRTNYVHNSTSTTDRIIHDPTIDNERQAEIKFHNNNSTWTAVVVEKNLRTIDLCELLKMKNRVSGDRWTIVEEWIDFGIERTLDDHEDILQVYKESEAFTPRQQRKFHFREDFLRYHFFNNPENYFPLEMIIPPTTNDRTSLLSSFESAFRGCLMRNDVELPRICSYVWVKSSTTFEYMKTRLLLVNRKLYISESFDNSTDVRKQSLDNDQPTPFAHLSDYHIYKIPNAKKSFNAPFQWGACLRPASNAEAEDTEAGVSGLKVITFNSERSRTCWLTAMRLAKYGKQLKDNYRAFKNRSEQTGASTAKEQFRTYNVSSESFRSRVAMDFTGSVGRIVEDPLEAMAIAESEGLAWRRTWRPLSRLRTNVPQVDDTIHANKPWFHKAINREKAALLVKGHSKANGIFLVRESRSCPGAFVLTYKFSDRIFHAPIHRTSDDSGNGCVYTLDKGVTKFYDLVQLVDFYQLNSASLPTRLTQYVNNNESSSSSSSSSPSNNGSSISTSAASPSSSSLSTKPRCSPRKNDCGSSRKISPRS